MNIKETYFFNQYTIANTCDFLLQLVNENVYVGIDNYGNVSVLIKSNSPNTDQILQKSKLISVETNQLIQYKINNVIETDTFHVFRCFSKDDKDKTIFLELCDTYFNNSSITSEYINDVFMILSSFFQNKRSYTSAELQGLYTELYTIYYYRENCDLGKYWQSKDNLKFDFSITSKVKLEIKSTLKRERIHRFSHEQLNSKIYDIYILSYLLQYDDCGLSLEELLDKCLPILKDYPDKTKRLLKVKYNCTSEELLAHKYSEEYSRSNMRLYNASDIPHYKDQEGVSNAYYNSDFGNRPFIADIDIIDFLKKYN